MRKGKRLLVAAALAGLACAAAIAVIGAYESRPVLVCLGDSLTDCGGKGGHYCDWLRKFIPEVRVIDAGISGNTLEDGRRRFTRDVARRKPDVVLIALGANDFWQRMRTVDEMGADLEYMIASSKALGSAVIVASCFGDRAYWNEVCTEFSPEDYPLANGIAAFERRLCQTYGCIYVPNLQLDVKPNRIPPWWDETDHPSSNGNERVALRLLPAIRRALPRQ